MCAAALRQATRSASSFAVPRNVLVVGLGNPDCGDDGIGALVALSLAGRLPADVPVVVRSGDMLALTRPGSMRWCAWTPPRP